MRTDGDGFPLHSGAKTCGYICIFATVFFFSTYEVVNKSIFDRVDPLVVNFLRFFVGGLLIMPFALRKQAREGIRLSGKNVRDLFLVGGLNVAVSMSLLQLGIFYGNASLSALLFSCNPLFVAAFASLILGEGFGREKVAGFLLSLAGIMIVFWPGIEGAMNGPLKGDPSPVKTIPLRGFIFPILSAAVYGLYTVLGKRYAATWGSVMMNAYSFIFGSLILLPVIFFLRGTAAFQITASVIPQLMYISIFVSGVAYILYFRGLSLVGASLGSMVFFLKPVLAGFLAAIFLKEQISANQIIGGALIIGGLAMSNVAWGRVMRWRGLGSWHQRS